MLAIYNVDGGDYDQGTFTIRGLFFPGVTKQFEGPKICDKMNILIHTLKMNSNMLCLFKAIQIK